MTTDGHARVAIRSYRDIEAYQRSKQLLPLVYALVRKLPHEEGWGLASQLRRASVSVPANIAEGYGKERSTPNFKAALDTAIGSANEVIVHLEICVAIGYFAADEIAPLVDGYEVVARQLYRLSETWREYAPARREAPP